jgi:branched-chain amino acid transport system permease protein
LVPVALDHIPNWLGIPLAVDTSSHIEHMIFGSLIVFFLIAEPHGLAKLWSIGKEKLRIWPFPH